jgi:multicomponent Na+:H+ antiporter subunit D
VSTNLPVLLFLIPFLGALIAAAVGWIIRDAARWIALASLTVTAAVSVLAVPRVLREGSLHTHMGGWPPPIGIEVLLDPLSAFIGAVVAVVGLIVVSGAQSQVSQELAGRETVYYAAVLLLISGLMGIVVTGDLFNLFVQIEVASLSAYALVAAGGRGAPRAGMNYLIIGSLGASLYLMGVGFLFAATGTLNMADVARLIGGAEPRLVLVGGLLIVVGLGVKMALLPLHMWMPPAYQRAPAPAAAVMAPLVTKVSAYALLRVMFWVFGDSVAATATDRLLLDLLAFVGAAGILVGGVLALVQTDLRRLLAYSSIGQMGVVALGIGLANQAGLTGAVLHIANDALMKGVLFLAAGMALLRFGVHNVNQLSRLRGRAPWTAAAIVVAGLSLVGIPPLSGFFGKWYVLTGALADGRWALAGALVVGSLASVGYVFRIFEQLFFAQRPGDAGSADGGAGSAVGADGAGAAPKEGSAGVIVACVVLALLVVLLGLANERLVSLLILPGLPPLSGGVTGFAP